MTLQNRVTPSGDLVAEAGRGLVFGNRGCLHDDTGRVVRPFAGKRWIACRLEFRGRYRGPRMLPGRYTPLFFLDEATAFAAGHRPCAECRHADYARFISCWRRLHREPCDAEAVDTRLHGERVDPATRAHSLHRAPFEDLADGVFTLHDGRPHLVLGSRLLGWTAAGYSGSAPRPAAGVATVLTPPSLAALLKAGWESSMPLLHPSARSAT